MNILSAAEVKRRGVIALEEGLENGPLHIIKNSRLTCVVLKEEDYASLIAQTKPIQTSSLWDLLEHRPWTGTTTKKEIDDRIKLERASWNDKK